MNVFIYGTTIMDTNYILLQKFITEFMGSQIVHTLMVLEIWFSERWILCLKIGATFRTFNVKTDVYPCGKSTIFVVIWVHVFIREFMVFKNYS